MTVTNGADVSETSTLLTLPSTLSSTLSGISKREHALKELLSSERAYASDLAFIRDVHIPMALGEFWLNTGSKFCLISCCVYRQAKIHHSIYQIQRRPHLRVRLLELALPRLIPLQYLKY